MTQDEVIQYLIEEGYNKDFAEVCGKSIVSEESFNAHIIDVFREHYVRVMEQIEEASDDVQEFVSYSLIKSLTEFDVHICPNPYGTFSVLENSDLYKRAFAICGGVCFVIFDDAQPILLSDNKFHDIIDWSFFHIEPRKKIINAINHLDEEYFQKITLL